MNCERWVQLIGVSLALACGRDGQDTDTGVDTDGNVDVDTEGHQDTSSSTDEGTTAESETEDNSKSGDESTEDESTEPCDKVFVDLHQEPARVMLVLDKSGSMTTLWNHDGDADTSEQMRWTSLLSVVESITTQFNESIDFGAQLYPAADAIGSLSPDACIVEDEPEVSVEPQNSEAIMNVLEAFNASNIKGGTPTSRGMTGAIEHLNSLAEKDVVTSIVLITDGSANCDQTSAACMMDTSSPECMDDMFEVYDENLEPIVAAALADHGYNTYVVGIDIVNQFIDKPGNPKVNPFLALNSLAVAGGKPRSDPNERFYNATNEEQLQGALDEIAAQIRTCFIDLTEPPNNPPAPNQVEYVSFQLQGEVVPFLEGADACDDLDGWRWTNPNGPYEGIELCGKWCDTLKIEAQIDGAYECPPIELD